MSEIPVFLECMARREDERNEPTHAKNLRFIAKEIERLTESDKALARVWQALGITEYTGRHVADHVTELRAIVNTLPKCWRLVGGKLVQDAPIAPDATVFVPAEVLELSYASKFRVASVGSDCVIVTNDCGLRFAAKPEQLCNTEEAAEALESREDDR